MKAPQASPEGLILVKVREGKPKEYPQSNWRRAIRAFLDGIWSQRNDTAEGALIFENVVLSLQQGSYRVNWPALDKEIPRPRLNRSEIHAVTSDRKDVELGLAKFVLNDGIWQLAIEFPDCRLMLWKGTARTCFRICVVNRTF